jgi:hypothetical protein
MLALALVVPLAPGSIARADVIGPSWRPPSCAPLSCPDGSQPVSLSHSGCPSLCAPNLECQTAADCAERYGEGSRCEPTRFCVVIRSAGPGMSPAVVDACEPEGPCGQPVDPSTPPADRPQCSEVSRCIAPPRTSPEALPSPVEANAPIDSPSRGGCAGCTVASPRSTFAPALALALLALVALRHRG